MKKISLIATMVFAVLFIVNSCTPEREPTCTRRGIGTINELAVFPDTVAIGDSIVGQFKVTGYSGCSRFDGFYDNEPIDFIIPHEIRIPSPQIKDEGCICTEIAPIFNETYTYIPYDTGMYFVSYTIYGDILQHDTVYVY